MRAGCALVALAAACSADSKSEPPPATICHIELPPAPLCIEQMGCGNSIGVGRACSRGTGECNDNGFDGAIFCSVDFVADAPLNYCTRPCARHEECAENAYCRANPDNPDERGCLPIACDPEGLNFDGAGGGDADQPGD